jgi:biopolymer transport protein ExbD
VNLKPRRTDDPELNLISLIDVLLMLVIFFMVSSTFQKEGRIKVLLPQAAKDPLVITVTAEGSYRVNERTLINTSPATLRAALLKESGTDRSAPVTIRADAHATHQAVVTAMDVAGRLGFVQLNIATVRDRPPH